MIKDEFIKELRSALSGEVNLEDLNENIQYYDQYLSQEQQKGRTIDEIVDEIGHPRLIARTIIDTSSNVSSASSYYDEHMDEDIPNNRTDKNRKRTLRKAKIGIWAAILIILLVVIGTIAILGRMIHYFAPILIPLLLISIAVRLLTRRQN